MRGFFMFRVVILPKWQSYFAFPNPMENEANYNGIKAQLRLDKNGKNKGVLMDDIVIFDRGGGVQYGSRGMVAR